MKLRTALLVLAGGLTLTSCTDKNDDTATGNTDGGSADGGGDPLTTLTLSGHFENWGIGEPMAGATVCWVAEGVELCETADTDGNVAIAEVPAGSDGAITVDGSDVVPTVLPMVLGEDDLSVVYGLDPYGLINDLYAEAGLTADPTKGVVPIQTRFGAGPDNRGGTTFALDPPSGDGPYYIDATGMHLDLDATESIEGMGVSVYMNVDPSLGPYTIVAEYGGVPCDQAEYGVALPDIDVFPGKETHVRVMCE